MKHKLALLAALFFVSNAALAALTRDQAEAIALAQVPGGWIVGGGLDRVRDRLVWSFDLNVPGSRTITEVLIDADSGKVAGVRRETAAEQAEKSPL